MRVKGQLEQAQFENIDTASEAAASKARGMVYYNHEKEDILVGDGAGGFKRIRVSDNEPLGTIKASGLTEVQFQAEMDNTKWILCDGRSVAGSDYNGLTGFTEVPDARGTFLRGINNGRVDGNEDPDGERVVGVYQDEAVMEHRHASGTDGFPNGGYSVGATGFQTGGTVQNNTTGLPLEPGSNVAIDDETRPGNIAVNYFIKINR